VVDETRVFRLLRSMADDVDRLAAERDASEQRRADPMWLAGVKYHFVTAIEATVDVAQHICAAQGWGPPSSNGDAMRELSAHAVLPADLAGQMRRAVGFRNVLVHEYVAVDDSMVLARLADLADLLDFGRSIADWLSRPTSGGSAR
jgi:uncharacterized protein YutE (UPF0331/DUF86 family)